MARQPPKASPKRRSGKPAGRKRDYAAEYAKRIARRMARGETRQQARGHATPIGTTEAQIRRLRRTERIETFARRQAGKFVGTDDQTVADIIEAVTAQTNAQGMGYLNRLEAEIARMHAEYMGQTKRDKRGRRPAVGYNLDTLSETWELPPETFGYH